MWTDGCDHDGGYVRVDHGGSCCGCIRCAARGCRDNHAWRRERERERNFPTSPYLFIRFPSVVQFFHCACNLPWPHCEKCDFQFGKKVEAKARHRITDLTVSLHWGDESSIEVQVYIGQVGGWASVHHHLIQHLQKNTHTQMENKSQVSALISYALLLCQRFSFW